MNLNLKPQSGTPNLILHSEFFILHSHEGLSISALLNRPFVGDGEWPGILRLETD